MEMFVFNSDSNCLNFCLQSDMFMYLWWCLYLVFISCFFKTCPICYLRRALIKYKTSKSNIIVAYAISVVVSYALPIIFPMHIFHWFPVHDTSHTDIFVILWNDIILHDFDFWCNYKERKESRLDTQSLQKTCYW